MSGLRAAANDPGGTSEPVFRGFPITVAGQSWRTYLPAPRDAVLYEDDEHDGHERLLCLRPDALAQGAVTNALV